MAAPPRLTLPVPNADQTQFFESRVRPVLAENCFKCHGPSKQEAGLRLDTGQGVAAGSDSGPVLAPGAPDKSLLIAAVRRQGDVQMPPDKTLPPEKIEALVAWVKMGAPWPAQQGESPALTEGQRLAHARAEHWALQPVRRPVPPEVRHPARSATPVDRFLHAQLDARGLSPSAEADRRTLIRRATFDMTGLPPTPDEVEEFASDPSPDAYARLLDRLSASPRYGERWGRHWLDVARYADTRGYAFGRERRFPYAYTYRDYVIKAFNRDLPYDRFVVEQIAADRLELGDDKQPLAALGLLTVGRRHNNVPDDIDDRIDVVTRGFMGLTVACARCHDHKYDPIPTADYYSLYGVLASCREPAEPPQIGTLARTAEYVEFERKLTLLKQEQEAFITARHRELLDSVRRRVGDYLAFVVAHPEENRRDRQIMTSLRAEDLKPRVVDRWRRYLASHAKPGQPVFGPWQRLMALSDDGFAEQAMVVLRDLPQDKSVNPRVREALLASPPQSKADVARTYGRLLAQVYAERDQQTPPAGTDALREVLLHDGTPTAIPRDETRQNLNRAEKNDYDQLQKKIDQHLARAPGSPPRAMSVEENPRPFEPYVFIRGSEFRRGPSVPRQFLQLVAGPQRKPFQQDSGRLELAQAIVARDNPLTSRVIVNRVWMHHFGEPLVESPSDFGIRTPRPVQLPLLDYLAAELADGGWSLKRLHRELMLSATYRQESLSREACARVDPENTLWWRMHRRRLEFEAQRDALALVAGQLDLQQHGPPVELTTQLAMTRRAVYGLVDRQDLPNVFRVFDFASPDQSAARRPETTVPQQALFLMNSRYVAEQAARLAARREVAGVSDFAQRVDALCRLTFGRPATEADVQAARAYFSADNTPTVWERYSQALLLTNEFVFVD